MNDTERARAEHELTALLADCAADLAEAHAAALRRLYPRAAEWALSLMFTADKIAKFCNTNPELLRERS